MTLHPHRPTDLHDYADAARILAAVVHKIGPVTLTAGEIEAADRYVFRSSEDTGELVFEAVDPRDDHLDRVAKRLEELGIYISRNAISAVLDASEAAR